MRTFCLLVFCLILSLPASLFAYTTHRTTVGPLSMHFGTSERLAKQEKITQLDEPLTLTATLENRGNTPLAVKLTYTTIETLEILDENNGGLTPPALLELPARGSANVIIKVVAREGTYTAHYPVRLDAEFLSGGETVNAHIIQVIETDNLAGTPAPTDTPLNILPERGGLALSTLDTYRAVWNYDNRPQVVLPFGFQGNDPTSSVSIARQSMDRCGVSRQSIGMHPPWRGGVGNVGVQFRVQLPETEPISLSFFSAMRDTLPPEPPSDGVTYRVKVDGKTVYEKHDAERVWVAHEVDLSEFAGKEIVLTLESDPGPRRDTTCDQCYWGDVILFAGEKPKVLSVEEKQKLFAENLQAVKTAKSESPKTQVFNLDGSLTAAVTFGNNGFIDGVIGLGNAERQVQFDGLRVWVKGQLIGSSPSALSASPWREDESAHSPPKFLTENYLTARKRLVERLVPEERLAAIRILDEMIEFLAEGRCKPDEIRIIVQDVERGHWVLEDRTDVFLGVPGYPMGFLAYPFTIQENHIVAINLLAEEYLCTTGCCSNTHSPEEYYAEFWDDLGKFSRLQRLETEENWIHDQNKIAELIQSQQNAVLESLPSEVKQRPIANAWDQEIAIADRKETLYFEIIHNGPALQFSIKSKNDDIIDRIEFGPATHHAEKVYFGHGYCIEEPEAFTAHADGHVLSTSHVGMDFSNGLSVLQTSSFPPDSFIVDPQAKRYTLSVHPATTMTLLPGTEGALDCAIRFRPLHHAQASSGVATKAGRFVFDIWGGRYSEHLDIIKNAAKYGLTDSLFIVHNWQHYGYDDRLPDIFPPNPRLGTLAEMQEALELCNSLGMLYGVHDNYIDIYPDANGYNFDMTTFNANGQPRKAWNNYGIEAQSYQFRPDRIQPFLNRNLDMLVPELPMSAYFVDVFSSLSPVDYYDRTGKFHSRAETLKHWGATFDTIRNRLSEANKTFPSAVTISESGLDSLIGHLDGADCNFIFISTEPGEFRVNIKCKEWSRVPWFDAVHHTKFSLHGAGYSNRYEGLRGRELHGIESDDYITSEILTGHPMMVDSGSAQRGAVRKYWLAQDLIQHLADKEIESVEFVDGNIHRQKITWDRDGDWAVVYVNLDEKNDWAVSDDRVTPDFVLPQYGYLGLFRNGYSAIHKRDGRVVESSHRVLSDRMNMVVTNYINARQKSVDNLLPIVPAIESFKYLGENRFSATFKWDAKDAISQDLCVFVHCVERRQSWHHRPNEAVLSGAFPVVPTSQWNGEIITDNHSPKNAEGLPVMAIPDELPAGRYYLVIGLYDANGRGQRAKLMGYNTGADRYAVGWINVQRREGAVSDITFEPLDWDETELYERLLPPKKPVEFFPWFKTNGGFRVEITAKETIETVLITPLPDEPAMEIALMIEEPPKSVKALDETGRELREVPFVYNVGKEYPLVFTTRRGEFAYRVAR